MIKSCYRRRARKIITSTSSHFHHRLEPFSLRAIATVSLYLAIVPGVRPAMGEEPKRH
jgi:hypothetical protein